MIFCGYAATLGDINRFTNHMINSLCDINHGLREVQYSFSDINCFPSDMDRIPNRVYYVCVE